MRPIIFFQFLLSLIIIGGCEKDKSSINPDNILGTWVSFDKKDTLFFADRTNLWKNSDHFDYQIIKNSIEIRYSGRLFIYVYPTIHSYHLKGNDLTIDFSKKKCYGFERGVISYKRE